MCDLSLTLCWPVKLSLSSQGQPSIGRHYCTPENVLRIRRIFLSCSHSQNFEISRAVINNSSCLHFKCNHIRGYEKQHTCCRKQGLLKLIYFHVNIEIQFIVHLKFYISSILLCNQALGLHLLSHRSSYLM